MENASWKPTLIFDSETPDNKIQEIMTRYFGSYDDEWTILDGSSEFPYYLDSPKGKYNYYTSLIKENWDFQLNCSYGCYDQGIIAFEKERGDNVILGLESCPISQRNCFEEMKEAGIPVKKTKTAYTKKFTTGDFNEEMIRLLEEINEDEDVLFVHKSYLPDR